DLSAAGRRSLGRRSHRPALTHPSGSCSPLALRRSAHVALRGVPTAATKVPRLRSQRPSRGSPREVTVVGEPEGDAMTATEGHRSETRGREDSPTLMLALATVGFAVTFWAWALLSPLGASLREQLS